MLPLIGAFTVDTSLLTDAGTAIAAIAVAFVAALTFGMAIPAGKKVYAMVKSAISGA